MSVTSFFLYFRQSDTTLPGPETKISVQDQVKADSEAGEKNNRRPGIPRIIV